MKKTQGSVLLVSLVLLLIMTIAGLTAIRMTSLEEKMSGNYLDQQMAFRAAEVALLEAENHIATTRFDLVDFNGSCNNGYCFGGSDAIDVSTCNSGDDTPWQTTTTWSDSNLHRVATVVIDGISAQAKYIIEFRCYIAKEDDGPIPDPTISGDWALYFRITALASGGTEDARVMLQSSYKQL